MIVLDSRCFKLRNLDNSNVRPISYPQAEINICINTFSIVNMQSQLTKAMQGNNSTNGIEDTDNDIKFVQ